MANKASVTTGLHTGIMNAGCLVTLGAIVHLHSIPGMAFETADTVPPNITTVAGNPVLFVGLQTLGSADIPMARFA
jgi:hypothetical protein